MQIWRLQVVTSGMNIAKYCLDNKVAAMGWCFYDDSRDALKKGRDKVKDFDSYSEWCKQWDDCGVDGSVDRLANKIKIGDLIWMYNKNDGFYYIGRCNSLYRFNTSEDAIKNDACNQVGVEWYKYADTSQGLVPGAIITSLIRGLTFCQIHKTGVESFSKYAFNMASNKEVFKDIEFKIDKENFFSMLSNDDCEDLLYLYLYSKYGYVCIPSSNKKGTKDYEYDMVDPKTGTHYYAQVKQQESPLDASDYSDFVQRYKNKIYFLSTNSEVINIQSLGEFGEIVDPEKVYEFALSDESQNLLSKSMKFWLNLLYTYQNKTVLSNSKGVMFDTDSPENEQNMISESKISAYGNSKRYIDSSFNINDYVLYYKKGSGIIAVGKIISERKEISSKEEYYRNVEFIYPKQDEINTDISVSPNEIKIIAGHNFYFASTIKSPFVDKNIVEKVLNALKEKYERK